MSTSTPPKTQRIDKQLLLRRAEHNEGELSTLKEITLHQFDIEKIENLDVYCRNLEILYLQNNQIGKIENVHKLKQLRYLNLALNNIRRIENLSRCESLQKIDLTVNFVEDLLDVEELKECRELRELYLIGNPCSCDDDYKPFVYATLPQLHTLDSHNIEKSERITALQELPRIRERLLRERAEREKNKVQSSPEQEDSAKPTNESADVAQPAEGATSGEQNERHLEQIRESFKNTPTTHTPEARLKIARELAELRAKPPPVGTPMPKNPKPGSLFGPDGRVLRRNEGKWAFSFSETRSSVILRVEISKFVDTSLVDLDVHPTWLRVTIKGKILQLVLDEEIQPDDVIAERSKHSGQLVITMRKVVSAENGELVEIRRKERAEEEKRKKMEEEEARKKSEEDKEAKLHGTRRKRIEKLSTGLDTPSVDYRNIVALNEDGTVKTPKRTEPTVSLEAPTSGTKIEDKKMLHDVDLPQEEFEDDPSVPPLE
ncbi:Protein tilB [Gonapodya sp. JEL0774]|nr:Protein tilB [Gonapodya sp. JEL0774]